jgi:galactose mutarotase-like enzyme
MNLHGKLWTRRELEARLGRIEQIGGVRRVQSIEGPEAGTEQIQVRTGAGLSYTVLPSRGMDIGLAEFGGAPLCWLSPSGDVHPAYFNDQGLGWLRTAVGGLLMTCGLTQVGSPGEDNGEQLGLHGRAHHTPARQVAAEGRWEDDEYEMRVRGQIEEASFFGAHLRLTRTILSTLGQNSISIEDEVENLGFEPAPHMLLYHFNFGFPLMSEDTQITFPSRKVSPRAADLPVQDLTTWQPPQAAYQERVYYHEDLATDSNGTTEVRIRNPHFPQPGQKAGGPVTVRLAWETRNLPVLVQWKMPGMGTHVLGIEPANCHIEGRAAERERGTLVMLAPGQSLEYHLKITLLEE